MGINQLKRSSAKKDLGILGDKLNLASNVPLWQRSPVASWVALGRTSPAQGQGCDPSTPPLGGDALSSTLERHFLRSESSSGLSSTERAQITGINPEKGHEDN